MSQLDELVDQLTQSENVDAEDSLNDAACLTKLKIEVAQTVKKHELSFRNTLTRPSSAASSCSNQIPVPSAPQSPGVVQSMRDTRQQQQVNNLADQQSTTNPITIHRQVQSANRILQENLNRVISSDVQLSLQPSAPEQTDSDNVASNQHQPLQLVEPFVNPTTVSQSSIDATCAFPQLSTASNIQLPVFSGTLPPAKNTFPPARPINNTGLFENVPDHRTPVPVSFGNCFPTPSHSGPFQAYCPNSWSNMANGSFEPSNVTPRGPVYPSSQKFGNQNFNPYRQRNIHRSVKLPDIRIQKFEGDPLKWNEWSSMFSSTIHNNEDITDTERMSYLQSLVIGLAKDCICGFLCNPKFYSSALQELNRRFGNPQNVVGTLTKELEAFQRPAMNDHAALIAFASLLRKVVQTFASHGFSADLNATYLLRIARDKLPNPIKLKWTEHVVDNDWTNPGLTELSDWMDRQSRAFEQLQDTFSSNTNNHSANKNIGSAKLQQWTANSSNNTNRSSSFSGSKQPMRNATANRSRTKCPLDQQDHYIGKCPQFLSLDVSRRNSEEKKNSLCFNCLSSSHASKNCTSKVLCRHCNGKRHSLLHTDRQKAPESTNVTAIDLPMCEPLDQQDKNSDIPTQVYNPGFPSKTRNQLQVIPVTLFGNDNKRRNCYAILDNASTISYVLNTTADKVRAPKTSEFDLNVSHAFDESVMHANLVRLDIGKFNSDQPLFRLNYVHAVSNWTFNNAPVNDLNGACSFYPHLQHIHFPKLSDNKIQILLGVDATQYILEREFLQGPSGSPFALRNLLGWTITGPIKRKNNPIQQETNFLSHSYRAFDHALTNFTVDIERHLSECATSFLKTENTGTEFEETADTSTDSKRAVQILQDTIHHIGDRYEIGLLWKEDSKLENNYPVAKAQLDSLQRRLNKDIEMKQLFEKSLETDLEKGYVKPVTFLNPAPEKIWYLPHYPVTNPNKPGKVRRVANAASVFKKQSLNKNLLSGPDLLNNLVGLLLRFRQDYIAVIADIEAMFMQICIRTGDQSCLRFLWPSKNSVQQFQFTGLISGARCSPTTAIFVLQQTAKYFGNTATKDLMFNSFYMDDFVHSFVNEQKAETAVQNLRQTLSKGGFSLTKFVSNSVQCLNKMPKEHCDKEKDKHRVIGVMWNTVNDTFFHQKRAKVQEDKADYTLRKLLSLIACLFDPLGIIAPLLITLKIILQNFWKEGLAWDDLLSDEKQKAMKTWIEQYLSVPEISMPRCSVSPIEPSPINQLHCFCDASQLAYGAVIYIRSESANTISTGFVRARAKVAPLKQISIPKLELQAAVLGCRLMQFVSKKLTIPVISRQFWSDSEAVLAWIKSKDKLKTFIANRVQEIRNNTAVSKWQHISGKLNPADHVSRGIPACDINVFWLTPPAFLSDLESHWTNSLVNKEETNVTMETSNDECIIDVSRFSKWTMSMRSMAVVIGFIKNLRSKQRGKLELDDINEARIYLFRKSLEKSFKDAINNMKQHRPLSKNDRLLCLSPFFESGLLRVSGRTKRSSLPFDAKHPIILYSKKHSTQLYIQKCHEICMHIGVEYTRNYIQQKCHILGIRAFLRRRFRAQGLQPPMADLPDIRFQETQSPVIFTNVGVDYLGPFAAVHRDSELKTYICLFTCLLTRAIHLEVAEDLSTDKCLTAIRRFIARRGQPRLFLSDNGSNFLGARKQIRRRPLMLDHDYIKDQLLNKSVEWKLNPPSAPHFGGVWERLVQCVKRAFLLNLGSSKLTPYVFTTIVSEAECLVNSRPLTHVRSNHEDDNPLTPNHFLLGRRFCNVPGAVFNETLTLKSSAWTQVKQRLQQICKRLLTVFVPSLNKRQK
ncbi:uncharacterized protein LOC142356371 [Convolutriloba macropyga]|uniref:uncharacterized protein LOC142356371 n=1 Tax=Convolutriloba macropyga TaxID=536237 RepID=UPI003F521F75